MPEKRSARSLRPSPPTQTITVFAFPGQPAEHDGIHDSDALPSGVTAQSRPEESYPLDEISLEGPDAVEISDLLKLSINSPRKLDDQVRARWEILNDPSLEPSQVNNTSAEYLVPDTDSDQLIVAANLNLPNGANRQLIKRIAVSGTNLPSLIRSFQQVVAKGQFSPRLTKRLADTLLKAKHAEAQGQSERLSHHLHIFVRDCALILKKKKSVPVTTLYHRARWLERQARKRT
ncbi:MAG: hypothetical protein ACM3ZQ_05690 [Bacillota bacterium]